MTQIHQGTVHAIAEGAVIRLTTEYPRRKLRAQIERNLVGHSSDVNSVDFSPDGEKLASGSDDGIRLWDLAGLTEDGGESTNEDSCTATFPTPSPVYAVRFSPSGNLLASALGDKTIKLWIATDSYPTAARGAVSTVSGHRGRVWCVAFCTEVKLASGCDDNTVKLWDVSSRHCPSCVATLTGHMGTVRSVCFSPCGTQLASASDDATVRLWKLPGAGDWTSDTEISCFSTLVDHGSSVRSVAFSRAAEKPLLATGSHDKTIRVWVPTADNLDYSCQAVLRGHRDSVNSVAFSPTGLEIASASGDHLLKLWQLGEAPPGSAECAATVSEHDNIVRSVAFSPNGKKAASCGDDKTIKIWDLSVEQSSDKPESRTEKLAEHQGIINVMALSSDGTRLASGGQDKTIKVWDVTNGGLTPGNRRTSLTTLTGHASTVSALNFSADAVLLASGCEDGVVKVWDLSKDHHFTGNETKDCIASLTGHSAPLSFVAFAPPPPELNDDAAGMVRAISVCSFSQNFYSMYLLSVDVAQGVYLWAQSSRRVGSRGTAVGGTRSISAATVAWTLVDHWKLPSGSPQPSTFEVSQDGLAVKINCRDGSSIRHFLTVASGPGPDGSGALTPPMNSGGCPCLDCAHLQSKVDELEAQVEELHEALKASQEEVAKNAANQLSRAPSSLESTIAFTFASSPASMYFCPRRSQLVTADEALTSLQIELKIPAEQRLLSLDVLFHSIDRLAAELKKFSSTSTTPGSTTSTTHSNSFSGAAKVHHDPAESPFTSNSNGSRSGSPGAAAAQAPSSPMDSLANTYPGRIDHHEGGALLVSPSRWLVAEWDRLYELLQNVELAVEEWKVYGEEWRRTGQQPDPQQPLDEPGESWQEIQRLVSKAGADLSRLRAPINMHRKRTAHHLTGQDPMSSQLRSGAAAVATTGH